MDVPQIFVHALPSKEQRGAASIQTNLHLLSSILDAFDAAVALFDHCTGLFRNTGYVSPDKLLSEWRLIAARSGAISIYEFYQIGQVIDELIAQCPTVNMYIDRRLLNAANRIFGSKFPDFTGVRYFTAQSCNKKELLTIDRYANKIPNGVPSLISGSLFGDKYTNRVGGRVIVYYVNKVTVSSLNLALDERLHAFAPLENITRELLYAKYQRNGGLTSL